MKVRFFWGLLLLVFAVCASGQAPTVRDLKPRDIAGLRIWESGYAVTTHPDGRFGTWHYTISFKNESFYELSEVDVRAVFRRNGVVVAQSNAAAVRSFANVGFATKGTLLPYNKTFTQGPVDLILPLDQWTTDVRTDLEIVGAKTFRGKQDLHDINHLYSRLVASQPKDAIELFKKDPSLIKAHDADGFDASAAVYASSAPEVIKYVVEHGGTWTPRTKVGTSSMHFAAINGWPGALDLALAHKGNTNAQTKHGTTPLLKAIRFGYPKNVEWLLKHGANPNTVDPEGGVPAYWAIHEGQTEALKDLIAAGANRHYHNRGYGWMHFCADNTLMMPVVLSLGVRVDDCDARIGLTPLMVVAKAGYIEPAIWLLQHGADPNRKDVTGRTAFDYSKTNNTFHTDRFFRDLVRRYGRKT